VIFPSKLVDPVNAGRKSELSIPRRIRPYFALEFRVTEENHRVYPGSAHNYLIPNDFIPVQNQSNATPSPI
jgi:hypothetical protein